VRTTIEIEYLEEELSREGGRLGRNKEHDSRSRNFAVGEEGVELKTVSWARRSPILNQGQIGSCTGNAAAGLLATDSAGRRGATLVDEHVALNLYRWATRLDHIAGEYPPDDTGSTGLAVMKAAKKLGFIAAYRHAFSLRAMAAALQKSPVIVGMAWLTGCDTPASNGIIEYTGDVRGGHEVLCRAVDMEDRLFWFDNSWGTGWGYNGSFGMTFADFETTMHDGGDMTVPVW
jgi:hypothetical protein